METNNFDEGQQFLAQHLTGYQSRTYLENLFVNDISQYKFYQGFIKEKGIGLIIDKTEQAVKTFNIICEKSKEEEGRQEKVIGLFHLTC